MADVEGTDVLEVTYVLAIDYALGTMRDQIEVKQVGHPPSPIFREDGGVVWERYFADEDAQTYVEVRADCVFARRLSIVGSEGELIDTGPTGEE